MLNTKFELDKSLNILTQNRIISKPQFARNTYFNNLKVLYKSARIQTKHPIFTNLNDSLRFFTIYLNLTKGFSPFYVIHAAFRSMFLTSVDSRNLAFISISKLVARWKNTYNLLLNIFYSKVIMLAFTHKSLKDEALAFNWSYNKLSYDLFKYSAPYFFLKNVKHGDELNFIFRRFDKESLTIVFISDINFHRRTTFHLKRFNMYTIGLIPISTNPWLVQHPILVGSCNLFTQYFFLKLLLYFRGNAENYAFQTSLTRWLN